MNDLLAAVALVFVLEGMLPFLAPARWREWMLQITQQSDTSLRMMGLGSMILGVVMLNLVR